MEWFPDGARVEVTEGHTAPSENWIPEGKTGEVVSSMKIYFGPNRTPKFYYTIKWDDGSGERAIDHSKLKKI